MISACRPAVATAFVPIADSMVTSNQEGDALGSHRYQSLPDLVAV